MSSVMYGLLLVSFVVVAPVASNAKELSENFYRKFDLHYSEKFDKYLKAKGYSCFVYKLVTLATFKSELALFHLKLFTF